MKKRVTPEPSKQVRIRLKTTKVDLHNLKEKANQHAHGRGIRYENEITAIEKRLLANLVTDYEVMLRSLKNLGGFFDRDLHYSETKQWKASIGKPLKRSEIPAFMRPPRRRNRL